jgi:hypothetical protein
MDKFNQSNLLILNVWNNYELSIDNKLFNIQLFKYYLTKFWEEIMNKIDN